MEYYIDLSFKKEKYWPSVFRIWIDIFRMDIQKDLKMQILTANSLNDGTVVYYQKDRIWTQQFNCAHTFSLAENAERYLLKVIDTKDIELVGVGLISVEQRTEKLRPLSMRENRHPSPEHSISK